MKNERIGTVLFSLALFLTPLLAFAESHRVRDCDHPRHDCVVPMAEHWGTFETITFFSITLVALWLLTRFRLAGVSKV
jgi:hypothetical protein